MDATVLICTFNREKLLASALDTLSETRETGGICWEVVVVDNNSTDGTRAVVESRMAAFPVPLRLVTERQQGKCYALNTGIAASSARIIVFTDDDVRIPPSWLEAGVRPLLERTDIEYTGGPVEPWWEQEPPRWVHGDPGLMWGPIALLDYGAEPFIFEERQRVAANRSSVRSSSSSSRARVQSARGASGCPRCGWRTSSACGDCRGGTTTAGGTGKAFPAASCRTFTPFPSWGST
jgi:glycosyltransferase involved in cell wall biosynthesis